MPDPEVAPEVAPRRLAARSLVPALAVLLAVLTWPVATLHGRADLDGSWQLALHLAAHDGVDWGRALQFTWGPLGFLGQPRWAYPATSAAAFVAVLLGRAALCGTVLAVVRARFGLAAGLAAAFVAGFFVRVELPELLGALMVVWCVRVLARDRSAALPRGAVEAAAAFGVVVLLMKFNAGVLALGAVSLTALTVAPRLLTAARLAGAAVATFVLCWVATGNALADVGAYVHGSLEVARGYSTAMGIEAAPGSDYVVAAAAVAALLAVGYVATRRQPVWRRLVTLAVVGVLLFLKFKHAYVRHDAAHAHELLTALVLLPVALLRGGRSDRALVALGAVFVVALAYAPGRSYGVSDLAAARRFAGQAADLTVPGRRAALDARVRDAYVRLRPVDPALVAAARGRGAHVDPWDTYVVWAHRLRWAPVPVFQSYSAYTPYLDDRNARAVSDPDGPEVILRRVPPPAIDGRAPTLDSPAYQLAVVCHFREAARSGGWQLLERIANRCGTPVELAVTDAGPGRVVAVPAPRDPASLVVARFEPHLPSGGLRDLAYKAPPVEVELNGIPRRFVAENAGQPHLLRASPTDIAVPLGQFRDIRSVRLLSPEAAWRVRFYEVPFAIA